MDRERERGRARESERKRKIVRERESKDSIWYGLVSSYGRPTIVGYLMPNPFFLHINIYTSNNSV